MKIAILKRNYPKSFEIYQENVCKHLERYGVVFERFNIKESIPDDCDLVWMQGAPILDTYKVIRRTDRPIVTTIHGTNQFMIPLKFMTSNLKDRLRWQIKKIIQYCFWRRIKDRITAVITVSQYCKKCISNIYGFQDKRIYSIHHGYDSRVFNENIIPYEHSNPYFLHVSNGNRIKNIDLILKAFMLLDMKNIDLLIVAPLYEGPIPKDARIKFIGEKKFLSQDLLAGLYRGALAFVFPSLDETFGLPILEAMACGCPIITSNKSACPEIAGDAAIFVDPHQVEQIVQAMKKIITKPQTRNTLIERARIQKTNFSWEKSAAEHFQVFRRASDPESLINGQL
jgi:glycosyltransferase involved in cell wall biosynthesis